MAVATGTMETGPLSGEVSKRLSQDRGLADQTAHRNVYTYCTTSMLPRAQRASAPL